MNTLRVGYAQAEITPPAGIELTGFLLREQPSIGVHDPIFIRAAVLDDGRTRIGIVSCDLLAFSPEFDEQVRTSIAHATRIAADHVMIACTHTHSGPACIRLRGCGRMNTRWMERLRRQIVRTTTEAGARLHPATVHWGRHRADLNPQVAPQSHQAAGFRCLRRAGEHLGRNALQALRRARRIRNPRLRATLRSVRVPRRIPSIGKIEREIQKHLRTLEGGTAAPFAVWSRRPSWNGRARHWRR